LRALRVRFFAGPLSSTSSGRRDEVACSFVLDNDAVDLVVLLDRFFVGVLPSAWLSGSDEEARFLELLVDTSANLVALRVLFRVFFTVSASRDKEGSISKLELPGVAGKSILVARCGLELLGFFVLCLVAMMYQ